MEKYHINLLYKNSYVYMYLFMFFNVYNYILCKVVRQLKFTIILV